jgi:hypothetical protein
MFEFEAIANEVQHAHNLTKIEKNLEDQRL